ncbi:MAG: ribosomal protein S18-alanine N-acetyltransferase [Chloroflexota bacterium]
MSAIPLHETLTIRFMRLEDVEQVQAIDRISFSMPWPLSAYNYEIKNNPLSLLWVAEATHPDAPPHIVGMVVVWLILEEAHIANIAVHPDYRGRGISKTLLAVALKEAIRRGSQKATLEVRAHNQVAQKLYRRFGFEIVGQRPKYYRDNYEDALIMTVDNLEETYLAWLDTGEWKPGSIQQIKGTDNSSLEP